MYRGNKLVMLAVSMGLLLGMVAPALAQGGPSTDELMAKVAAYKLGQDRKPLEMLQEQVVRAGTDSSKRAELAKQLVAILGNAEATFEAKDFACRQLYLIGGEAEVPALAKLLNDEKLSHMGRYVLERMEEPAAGAALREAMGTTKGQLLIGVINSVGNRRDAAAVSALKPMLRGADAGVAAAAAAALGRIGGSEAQKALKSAQAKSTGELKDVVIDAYLRCADDLLADGKKSKAAGIYRELYVQEQPVRVRMAALRGLAVAQPSKAGQIARDLLKSDNAAMQAVACGYVAQQLPGKSTTRSFARMMKDLPAGTQVMLLDALGVRGDVTARAAVVEAIKSQDEAVRLAAIKALAMLGDASDVNLLAGLAAKGGREAEPARNSLARLRGKDVDSAILAAMRTGNGEVQVQLVRALTARGATSAVPALLQLAQSADNEAVRIAALDAVGTLGSEENYAAVVQCVVNAKADGERKAASSAAASIATRISDKDTSAAPIIAAMGSAAAPAKVALLGNLSRIAGEKALGAVRAAMKDSDASVQDAATRAIASWPDATAIADMMGIVKGGNETGKVLALRGLQRVLPGSGLSAGDALGLCRQMMEVCQRAEEKRLVLAGVAEIKDAGAFELVTPALADEGLRNEAATAVLKIAKAIGADKAEAKAALQKVVEASVDDGLKKQAQELLGK